MKFEKCSLYLIELNNKNDFCDRHSNLLVENQLYHTDIIPSLIDEYVLVVTPELTFDIISISKNIIKVDNIQIYNKLTDYYGFCHMYNFDMFLMYNCCVSKITNQQYFIISSMMKYYKRKYYIQYGLQNYLKPKQKNYLSQPYHFLLSKCSEYTNVGELKCEYSEVKYSKLNDEGTELLIFTDDKKFLNKCINKYNPTNIKIVSNTELENYSHLKIVDLSY